MKTHATRAAIVGGSRAATKLREGIRPPEWRRAIILFISSQVSSCSYRFWDIIMRERVSLQVDSVIISWSNALYALYDR
jgi:hypothetical protein